MEINIIIRTLVLLCGLYLLFGIWTLDYLLKTRFLRPLTQKEMLFVVLGWPLWL